MESKREEKEVKKPFDAHKQSRKKTTSSNLVK
jgi:hypothetical protein